MLVRNLTRESLSLQTGSHYTGKIWACQEKNKRWKKKQQEFETLKFNPKIELNQHLEKPIKPKQFAIKKVMKQDTGEKSKNDENI